MAEPIDMDGEPGLLNRIRETCPELYHGILKSRATRDRRLKEAAARARVEGEGDPLVMLPEYVEDLRRRMRNAEAEADIAKGEVAHLRAEMVAELKALADRLNKAGDYVKTLKTAISKLEGNKHGKAATHRK